MKKQIAVAAVVIFTAVSAYAFKELNPGRGTPNTTGGVTCSFKEFTPPMDCSSANTSSVSGWRTINGARVKVDCECAGCKGVYYPNGKAAGVNIQGTRGTSNMTRGGALSTK